MQIMTTEDKTLVSSAKFGDSDARVKLFQKYNSFVEYCFNIMSMDFNDHDDFQQLCYLALLEALNGYDLDKQTSFLAYWKYYILSEYFQFRLQMRYCMAISRTTYNSLKSFSNINQIILSKYYEIDHYHIEDKCINDVMFESIWEIVDADLSEKNAYILRQIYEEGRSLTSLSKELGIGVERVRQRKIRSLNRLRENVVLRGIYYAYFY